MSHGGLVRIGPDEYARRIKALLSRGGLSSSLPRRERDRWILYHAIARRLAPGEHLSEREVDGRIADFLIGPGHFLEIDRVTLRRALVDEGFVDRDPAGQRLDRRARLADHCRHGGKTDRRDALQRARLARAGELTAV